MSSASKSVNLSNTSARITHGDEVRIFNFVRLAGPGRPDSSTWKATDRHGMSFAIKLVPKTHYESHSIEGELQRTRDLGPRFAKIISYGELVPDDPKFKEWASQFYSIVVEWFEGVTFDNFCRDTSSLDRAQFLQLAQDLCEVLATLQEKNLCHNDLKGANILITKERKAPD